MEELKKVLERNDIDEARAILNNEILWNSSNEETFYEMVNLCEVYNVFDKNDEKIEEKAIDDYTESDLIDLNTNLTFNFSKERCLLAYKVSRYINGRKSENKEKGDFSREDKVVYTTNNEDLENKNKDIIKKLAIIGAGIITFTVVSKMFRKRK